MVTQQLSTMATEINCLTNQKRALLLLNILNPISDKNQMICAEDTAMNQAQLQ